MLNSKSARGCEGEIERSLLTGSNSKTRKTIIALATLCITLVIVWAAPGSKADASVDAVVAHSQPRLSRSWVITATLKDGTVVTGQAEYDAPGPGSAVSFLV